MIRNYFKTAFRNLSRNKSYALINITGLGIGIAASLLIFLVIQFETSFDNFHPKKNNIYRIGTKFHTEDGYSYSAGIAFPAGPVIKAELPQVKTEARIYQSSGEPLAIDYANAQTKKFKADLYYTEPDFFSLFNFPWLAGDPKTTLSKPNQAALTQKTAEKFFGDWHLALGKTITHSTNKNEIYTITGIIKDVPANSDFPLDVVVSYSTLENTGVKGNLTDWVSTYSQAYVFVELPANVSISKFNTSLEQLSKKHKPADYANDSYVAQPLTEIHYDNRFGNYRSHTFSKSLVLALELIGLFLILIACVNFINLATAQAVNRSKEVGVRKVLGSDKRNLRIQFFCETAIITASAIAISVLIAFAAVPFMNHLLNVEMTVNIFKNPAVILFLAAVLVVVTVLSGFYPAMILSGFNPITALKTKITSKMAGGISLRRVLVVLQFSIAHILIIGMLIVVSQMNFFKNTSLGFDKEAILNVPIPGDSISHTKLDFIKNELSKNSDIKSVSFSFSSPAADGNWNSDFMFDHATKNTNFNANLKWADPDYFKTYNIKFVAGRPYYPSDTVREFVVNETLLRKLGVTDPNQAIGKQIGLWDGQTKGLIVGVIRDFNSYSLRRPMAPVLLSTWKDVYQTINLKIKPGQEQAVIDAVGKIWNNAFPDYLYEYSFLDKNIANFYKQENQLSQLYKIFAAIAILISCLGLYGLVSFMAAQRTKELGIRKVLGATSRNIVYLLSKEFTLLIIIAFVIAAPVAWYFMHKWLQNYTYRIQLGVGIFLIAVLSSMVIAWITVGHRAIKAAIANPVKSLRTE
jgi:ABC-type antimicrobial peptide transport system permease subunit